MDTEYRVPLLTDSQQPDLVVQSLLEHTKAASGGRLLNMHRQMATAPTVLADYMGLRDALAAHATAGGRTRSAVAVAASAADRGEYTLAVNTLLAKRGGWSNEQITAIAEGRSSGALTGCFGTAIMEDDMCIEVQGVRAGLSMPSARGYQALQCARDNPTRGGPEGPGAWRVTPPQSARHLLSSRGRAPTSCRLRRPRLVQRPHPRNWHRVLPATRPV